MTQNPRFLDASTATDQEIFDFTLDHLRTQGVRSTAPDSSDCLYRGPYGLMCAFGPFIHDSEYKLYFEGKSSVHLIGGPISRLSHLRNATTDLLRSLQCIHDTQMPLRKGDSMDEFEAHMTSLANMCGLTYAAPTACA